MRGVLQLIWDSIFVKLFKSYQNVLNGQWRHYTILMLTNLFYYTAFELMVVIFFSSFKSFLNILLIFFVVENRTSLIKVNNCLHHRFCLNFLPAARLFRSSEICTYVCMYVYWALKHLRWRQSANLPVLVAWSVTLTQ